MMLLERYKKTFSIYYNILEIYMQNFLLRNIKIWLKRSDYLKSLKNSLINTHFILICTIQLTKIGYLNVIMLNMLGNTSKTNDVKNKMKKVVPI